MKQQRTISPARLTVIALISAIAFGLILRLIIPTGISSGIDSYLLSPIKTMYLNALKLVVTPVVFFMISSSIASISDFKAYGRIGFRVISRYLLTSLAAVCLGILISWILSPGNTSLLGEAAAEYTGGTAEVSLLDTIVDIVPKDLISPFKDANMIQVIFLAVIIGYCSGLLAQTQGIPQLKNGLELLNKLFLSVSGLILKLIPVGTFCAVSQLILQIDGQMLMSLINLILTVILADLCMMLIYGIMFMLSTRENPIRLLRKCLPMISAFLLFCSTSAVMTQTLDTCTNKLGVDPKISSFSIPLGSTMNMDGACIYLTIASLFLAKVYGIDLTPSMLVQLGFTTLILSVGAPPVPGSGFICLSVLVLQLGLPMESIGYLLGIDQLMSMFRTMVNGSGDIVVTTIVAAKENLLDRQVFRSNT